MAKVFDTRPKQLESLENGLFRLAAATVAAVTASNGIFWKAWQLGNTKFDSRLEIHWRMKPRDGEYLD